MTPDEHLRVPYTMMIASVRRADGTWVRRAEYPELPGCIVEADSPLDAIDRLDMLREETILRKLARGEPVPVPRPPLARLLPLSRAQGDDVGEADSRAAQRVGGEGTQEGVT